MFITRDPFYALWSDFQLTVTSDHAGIGIPDDGSESSRKIMKYWKQWVLDASSMYGYDFRFTVYPLLLNPAHGIVIEYARLMNREQRYDETMKMLQFMGYNETSFTYERFIFNEETVECAFLLSDNPKIHRHSGNNSSTSTSSSSHNHSLNHHHVDCKSGDVNISDPAVRLHCQRVALHQWNTVHNSAKVDNYRSNSNDQNRDSSEHIMDPIDSSRDTGHSGNTHSHSHHHEHDRARRDPSPAAVAEVAAVTERLVVDSDEGGGTGEKPVGSNVHWNIHKAYASLDEGSRCRVAFNVKKIIGNFSYPLFAGVDASCIKDDKF